MGRKRKEHKVIVDRLHVRKPIFRTKIIITQQPLCRALFTSLLWPIKSAFFGNSYIRGEHNRR